MSGLSQIYRWLVELRHWEVLVTRRGLGLIIIVALAIVSEGWRLTRPWTSAPPAIEFFGLLLGIIGLGWFVWAGIRYFYIASASGIKIGVAYSGHRVPLDDWVLTRQSLSRLCAQATTQLSLRILDHSSVPDPARAESWCRRNGFQAVVLVTASPLMGDQDGIEYLCHPVVPDLAGFEDKLRHATKVHGHTLWDSLKPDSDSLASLLSTAGRRLYELLLLYLAAGAVAQQRFPSAELLACHLDDLISHRIDPRTHPRRAVRALAAYSILSQVRHSLEPSPDAEEAKKLEQICDRGIQRLGPEYPLLYPISSRLLFLSYDLDAASARVEEGLATNPPPEVLRNLMLNRAVIALFQARWATAAASFQQYFELPNALEQNWEELITFADLAYDMGHPSARYLQLLYRKIAGTPCAEDLMRDVDGFVSEDKSREGLRSVLRKWGHRGGKPITKPKYKKRGRPRKRKPGDEDGHANENGETFGDPPSS